MTRRIKLRTLLMGGLFTLLFVGLIFRLFWVQVVQAEFWSEQAMNTWITSDTIRQERGMLLDRDGKVLAADAAAYTIAVGPKRIAELEEKHPEWKLTDKLVAKLHEVLGTSESSLRSAVASKKDDGTFRDQREVRPDGWKVDKAVKDELSAFRDELRKETDTNNIGLYFMEDTKRYYPNGSLASHILGYENKEGEAVIGMEKELNDLLMGEPGFIKYQKDNTGTQLPNGQLEYRQAIDGSDVALTIDRDIQFYIEEALRKAYEQYKPISITAIAADPNTMEILGMSSMPDFNPNAYWEKSKDQAAFRDNAIQSLYEPGSTFKILTLAAAVQEGLFDPNEMYMSGSIKYTDKDRPIRDHNWTGWGEISMLDGLKHSSNVAFVKLGYEKLGKTKLVNYINAFGFGQKTGIELPNEVSRSFSLDYPSEVATAAFGQGKVLVTPIQQVAAVAAVANGGKLLKPHVVKSITDPATGDKIVTEPELIRQVISEQTSRKVGEYLEQVVSDQDIGTGKKAYIPGYKIAGKTGTAQKVSKGEETDPNGTGYAKDRYVVSFIGYAPVEAPKIVLYVIMDEPQAENVGGGSLVAPIFKEIMKQSLEHLGVKPNLPKAEAKASVDPGLTKTEGEVTSTVPDVVGMTVTQAQSALKAKKFPVGVLGKGTKVLQQLPKASSVMQPSQRIYLLTDTHQGNVPDLKGLSLRDAVEMCKLLQVPFNVEGEGYVESQKAVKIGSVWTLQLKLSPAGEPEADPGGGVSQDAEETQDTADKKADSNARDGE
ncbi:penicillin-binding transpeptidase domain-containing protein [Cohnella sp. GCM10027633]|uniref:penicillin-binding transpeptidase domain-containing protein n=1 Tax=unclassified Cohnella TaxID=2636738 RepID=UPI00363801A3